MTPCISQATTLSGSFADDAENYTAGGCTAVEYIDRFDFDALPDDASHLLWLCYSLVNVSFPVEVWRQPRVPDSGAASMDVVVEPAV